MSYDSDLTDAILFGEKACNVCHVVQVRSSEHFDRDAGNRDGLHVTCKDCRRERQLAKPRTDGVRRAAQNRQRYQADAEYREKRKAASRRAKVTA